MRFSSYALGALALPLALSLAVACADKTIKAPQSDTQTDCPDDPGNGNPPLAVDAGPDASIVTAIPIQGGTGGVGFDDLSFSGALGRVVVPAGRTGDVDLVDPASFAVTVIGGFTAVATYDGSADVGATSADEGAGAIFVLDRNALVLDVVDPTARNIARSTAVASAPDYVRFVASSRQVWVTEPSQSRIEVFSLSSDPIPIPSHLAFIALPSGVEGLVIDGTRSRAYTNGGAGTAAIDLTTRVGVASYPNGCTTARGLALDEGRGVLLVACNEGKVSALDLSRSGAQLSALNTDKGIDHIAYDPTRARLYVPSGTAGTMAVITMDPGGRLALAGNLPTIVGSTCVTVDNRANVYVCDPADGQLLTMHDPF
jgi:DNA-binding beta-propeller fold protein YncE